MEIHDEAFSSSQILSKIWLVEEVEKIVKERSINQPLTVAALGGWYGLINFLFRVRDRIAIKKYINVDIDEDALFVAENFNESWIWKNYQFEHVCADANTVDLSNCDVIINTSIEHFSGTKWFNNIPEGRLVAFQSNDMTHADHCHNHSSLEELVSEFPLSELIYSGEKKFEYPTWAFNRFMIIGIK